MSGLLTLALFLLFSPTSSAVGQTSNDRVTVSLGAGGGGALYHPAINPRDGDNIFIVCDMGSNFSTRNGNDFHNPGVYSHVSRPPQFFFNPHDEHIVYAASNNVVNVSHNKGETWNDFFPQSENIAGVTNDGNYVRAIVKPSRVFARSDVINVYVHPKDPNTIFVFSRGAGYGAGYGSYSDNQNIDVQDAPAIHVTRNGGLTWQVLNDAIPGGRITHGDDGGFTAYPTGGGGRLIDGDWVGGLRFCRVEMIVFKNELHLLSAHGYFRFDQATGALIDHNLYRNSAGHFVISEDGETITAYQIIRRDDFRDSYNNAGQTTFPGYVSMKLAPGSNLYPRHIFKTMDGGKTFTLLSGNFATDLVYTFHGMNLKMPNDIPANSNVNGYVNLKDISVSDDGTLCVVFSAIGRPTISGGSTTSWSSGVAKTTNEGQTWEWIQTGAGRVSPSIQFPSGVYPMFGTDPGHNQSGITVSKSDPDHIITTNAYDACETRDGGLTWRTMSTRRMPSNNERTCWATNGIEPAGQMTLAINPFNKQHHLAGWTDIGMWESVDGGKSWTRRNDVGNSNTSAIAYDPHNEGVVLAAFPNRQRDAMRGNSNTGYTPKTCLNDWQLPCEWDGSPNTSPLDGRTGVIRRSEDGGQTWTTVASRIIVGIDGIIFDPANAGFVYTSTMGGGVYRSMDGGLSWHPFNHGMQAQIRTFNGAEYRGIQVQRLILGKDRKTLLALLSGSASSASNITQVYALDIGSQATAWQEIFRPNPTTIGPIWDMDKTAAGILYAAPMARRSNTGWDDFNGAQIRPVINGGAFVSENNGQDWRQIFDPRIDVKVLRTDSTNENIIFLGGRHKIWVSLQGKDTTLADWVELSGFHFADPDLIVEDPTAPTRIYVTTWGGGTWHLQDFLPLPSQPVN